MRPQTGRTTGTVIIMVTTHLGKFPVKKVNDIRDIIFDQMMADGALLYTEILFYLLVDRMNVPNGIASNLALDVHYGGRQVSSRGLKEVLVENRFELEQRQVTQFVKRFMKSSRVEVLDKSPTTWQMNGFSTFEPPYFAGYSRNDSKIENIQPRKKTTFAELINRRNILKHQISQKEQLIQDSMFEPTIINERNELKSRLEEITQELTNLHN